MSLLRPCDRPMVDMYRHMCVALSRPLLLGAPSLITHDQTNHDQAAYGTM